MIYLPRQGHWGGDFAIASNTGAVNMTALGGAGGGWAAAAITLLSGCCNMILGRISSGFQPPLPSNDVKDLRRCVSFGSMNVIRVYHCDLWISYASIILICNVTYMYPFDLWMLQLCLCITLIRECCMNVISPVCFVFHSRMFYLAINTFSLSLSLFVSHYIWRLQLLKTYDILQSQWKRKIGIFYAYNLIGFGLNIMLSWSTKHLLVLKCKKYVIFR